MFGLPVGLVALALFFLMPVAAEAANLYWVGDDAANTSVATNWKTTDPAGCGSGDASAAPTTTDVAIFDADCDNGATINSTFSVLGINFNSGYTGTVTQATTVTVTVSTSGWTQADGTFTGGDAAITVNDSAFALSGGTFTNTSGGLNLERNLTITAGTFTNTSKTVTFTDSTISDDTTITCTGTLGGTVVITKDVDGDFINSAGCSIELGANPTTTIDQDAVTEFTNNGTITIASGTWTVNDFDNNGATMINNGTITHSGNGWDINSTSLTNNASSTITYAGTAMSIENSFTQNGTFNLSGITITFDDTSSTDDTTITCSGTLGGTVVITKDTDGDFVNASGCSIGLGANPTTTIDISGTTPFTNNGTITISSGTWTVNNAVTTGVKPNITNAGTITHSGNGWDFNDTGLINNGTITYAGTAMSIENSFTQNGTFNLSGITITFDDTSGTDDTTITCSGTLGGTVVITKDNDGDFINSAGCSIELGASPTTTIDFSATTDFLNNGTVTIASGTWTVIGITATPELTNAGTITHSGNGWDFNNSSLVNNASSTITYSGTAISIERSFTQNGTFNLSGITVTFDDTDGSDDTTITCTGALGGTVVITKDTDGDFINAAGCSIELGASPTTTIDFGAANDFVNNGTVTIASGTWTVSDAASTTTGILTNSGTITHSGNGWDLNDVSLTNNATATITYAGTNITMERNLTQYGTFDLTGKTITFDDSNSSDDTTITCTGTLGGTVTFNKDGGGDFINDAGCSISMGINNTVTLGAVGTVRNDGTITVPSGTWTIDTSGTSTGNTFVNNGTITHSGNGWVITDSSLTNNASSTITYSGTAMSIERAFTQSGTFDLTSITITFDDTSLNDDTTVTCSGSLGGTVVFTKDINGDFIVASGCSIALGASPTSAVSNSGTITNNGTITISSGTWTLNGNATTGGLFTNAGIITHSGNGWDINDVTLTNNGGATITYAGTAITMEHSFTQNGTFNLSGVTITFDDTNSLDDTTVTCGATLGGNIVLNKDTTGADTTFGSSCTVAGSFTRTDGAITNPASAYTLTVQGDFSMSTTDTFGGSNLTLTLGGGNNQTVTQNAGSIAGPVIIDKSANTATLATALDLDSNLTITAGTFDVSAAGCSGVSCAITIGGNWTNSVGAAGFTYRTGTVTLDGTNQTLAGTTTFYNLTKVVTSAATLTFPAGPTAITTVAGTWRAEGASGQLLSLRSSSDGTQWKIDPQGTRTVSYLDVKDSNNTNATAVSCSTICTDSLNNTNWSFTVPTLTQNDWRWYVDSDAENVTEPWGTPDLGENTLLAVVPATNAPPVSSDELRLRMNITVGASTVTTASQAFKLQYVAGTDCTTASGWADVGAGGGATIWRFATSGVTDATTLTALKLATSDVLAAYAKANASTTNPNSVSAGQDMEWDWHLQHNGAADATTYCFRMVKSDGSVLDTYNADGYPKLETAAGTANLLRHGNVFIGEVEKGFTWVN